MAIFSPLWVKMSPNHLLTCVTSLLVRLMPKVSITVVATAKIVTKKAKTWPYYGRLFLAIRATLMAPTLMSHEYLLPPMIWAEFYHFRISGSIVCRQLRHTFMDVMKGISPFGRNCEVWPQWMLNMFPTVICPVKEPDIGSACLLPETETCSYREECSCGKCHTR